MREHTLLALACSERNLLRSCSDGAQAVRDLDVVEERGRINRSPATGLSLALLHLCHRRDVFSYKVLQILNLKA